MIIITKDIAIGKALQQLFEYDGFVCEVICSRVATLRTIKNDHNHRFLLIDESAWKWFTQDERAEIAERAVVTLVTANLKKSQFTHHEIKKPVKLDELLATVKRYCRVVA